MSTDRLFDRYLEGERPADHRSLSGIELPAFLTGPAGATGERPGEILERRLASGEIDAEAYDALREKLRAAH